MFGGQIHGFFTIIAAQGSGFGEFQGSHGSIFSHPGEDCVIASETQPFFVVDHGDFIFGLLDGGLAVGGKAVYRGVAAEQGSEGGEKLRIKLIIRMDGILRLRKLGRGNWSENFAIIPTKVCLVA